MNPINTLFSGAGPLFLFLAKATVLLVAALVATFSLRRSTAGARHLVWLAALVGVLALPLLARIPTLHLGVLPSSLGLSSNSASDNVTPAPAGAPVAVVELSPAAKVVVVRPALAPIVPTLEPTPIAVPLPAGVPAALAPSNGPSLFDEWNPSVLTIIAGVWSVVALGLVGWLVAGAISVRRIVFGARELTSPDWAMPLCEVADRLDLELPPRLVLSDRIEMAFACRALTPTIVLPASAESWSDDRRRAVLFHELAHVKRHDLLGHTLGRLACALYWFHPLVWTAAKNLRAESERACDDLVLSCGARPSEYAQHLLDMVTSVRNHGAPIMALPMARKKEFEGRMLAILDPAIRRASPGRLQAAVVVATLVMLSVTVAAVAPATATPANDVYAMSPAPAAPEIVDVESPVAPVAIVQPRLSRRTEMARATSTSASMSTSTSVSMSMHEHEATLSGLDDFIGVVARQAIGAAGIALRQTGTEMSRALLAQQKGDTSRLTLLLQILAGDADASVRRTAAWGLNEVRSQSVSPALIKALKQDADASVREMSAWALAEHEGADAASALADALLHDSSARVRATSAWALGETEARMELSALETALSDADTHVRYTAIWAIGQLGVRTAPSGLTNFLTDASKDVRLVTAWALGEIEDKATAPAIISAFQTETDNTVRGAELRALAAMGQTSPALVDLALKSNDPELRRRAVAMLAGPDAGVWPWPWPWPQPRPTP